jgi:signal transduction histidine kinase
MAPRGDDDNKPDRRENPHLLSLAVYEISLAVHEIRGPASVVGGYLRMLQRDTDPAMSERQKHMVEEAEKSCARLVAIVAELSDIGKLDGGLVSLARRPLDVFALVGEVAELVHEAKDREVHLTLRGDRVGAPMSGDAERLRAAFNAIFRAILREKPGPATVVAELRRVVRDGGAHAVVIVSDEASVQEAYEREPGPFYEKRGGLGLALPLARRVIEGHGGRLWSPKPVSDDDPDLDPVTDPPTDPVTRGSAIVSLPLTE